MKLVVKHILVDSSDGTIFGKMQQSFSDIPIEFAKSIDLPCLEVLKLNSRNIDILARQGNVFVTKLYINYKNAVCYTCKNTALKSNAIKMHS